MTLNKIYRILLILLACFFLSCSLNAQTTDSLQDKRDQFRKLLIGGSITYAASMVYLNHAWYSQHERESFHFFNDNAEWYQIDKGGHFLSTYHITSATYFLMQSAGYNKKKTAITSALVGFGAMLPIEILDGFSTAYGASPGDLLANAAGAAVAVWQMSSGKEYVKLKVSFYRTEFAQYRPSVLGENAMTQWLKDYNGHTFWMSLNMDKMISGFPHWLNLGIGYGAHGMVYARPEQNTAMGFNSYRQLYVGIDPDLSSLKSRKKWVNALIKVIDKIHLPAPVVIFSEGNSKIRIN